MIASSIKSLHSPKAHAPATVRHCNYQRIERGQAGTAAIAKTAADTHFSSPLPQQVNRVVRKRHTLMQPFALTLATSGLECGRGGRGKRVSTFTKSAARLSHQMRRFHYYILATLHTLPAARILCHSDMGTLGGRHSWFVKWRQGHRHIQTDSGARSSTVLICTSLFSSQTDRVSPGRLSPDRRAADSPGLLKLPLMALINVYN